MTVARQWLRVRGAFDATGNSRRSARPRADPESSDDRAPGRPRARQADRAAHVQTGELTREAIERKPFGEVAQAGEK